MLLVVLAGLVIPATAQGGLDLNGYCAAKGWGRATLVGSTAYSWKCEDGSGNLRDMSIEEACHMQYGNDYHAAFRDMNDAYSWYCDRGTNSPASAPQQQPQPQGQSAPAEQQQQPQPQPQQSDNRFLGSSSPLSGNYIRVNISGLRIRTGPGTSNTSLGQVVEGNYYQLLEQSNGWGKISTSRGDGWVYLGSGYASVYGGQSQHQEVWCSLTPNATQDGWQGVGDPNYIIRVWGPGPMNWNPDNGERYYIYFKNEWINVSPHGYSNGHMDWGVSTGWSLTHLDWRINSNWEISYTRSDGTCPFRTSQ